MPPEITPDQKVQLDTWASQRDAILAEISVLQIAKDALIVENKKLANSNTEIDARMNVTLGKIAELETKEREFATLVSIDVANLEKQKAVLEADIAGLNRSVGALTTQKTGLEASVAFLVETFKSINERVGLLESVVNHVTVISDRNVGIIGSMTESVKSSLSNLIEAQNAAVEKSNFVISELPKVFLEVQRKSLVREVVNKIKQ